MATQILQKEVLVDGVDNAFLGDTVQSHTMCPSSLHQKQMPFALKWAHSSSVSFLSLVGVQSATSMSWVLGCFAHIPWPYTIAGLGILLKHSSFSSW